MTIKIKAKNTKKNIELISHLIRHTMGRKVNFGKDYITISFCISDSLLDQELVSNKIFSKEFSNLLYNLSSKDLIFSKN